MIVRNYLKNAKSIYDSLIMKRVVLGNQSADLDSIVSCISMAYFLSSLKHDNSSSTTYIPIINSTKSIIQSKKECLYLFEYFSIDFENDLIFINDWKKNEIIDVTLVDHNELDMREKNLGIDESLITAVIDHRFDKQLFINAKPRVVDASAGSCSTLIADLILKSNSSHLIDHALSTMLLFPILSDTSNLTIRASQKDLEIFQKLKSIAPHCDTNLLYSKIESLKLDSSNEDLTTSLNKDYKQYENGIDFNWGLSSVSFSVKQINESTDLAKIKEFMEEKNLKFFGILSCFKTKKQNEGDSDSDDDGEFKRDLALFAPSELLINNIESKLIENLTLVTKQKTFSKNLTYLIYDIDHVKFTRKHWQPLLEKILSQNTN